MFASQRISGLFTILLLFTASFLIRAQENELSKMTIEELMGVTITTPAKSAQKLWEASAKVILITQQMIKERGYKDLTDVLRFVPQFQIQSEFGHWMKGSIVNLRGHRSGDSGNNKFQLLIDGLKISDEAEEGLYMGLNSIPINSIRQIEVAYGPNSTLYGRDAYTGVINIITKEENHFDAGFSYGTYNTQRVYTSLSHQFNSNVRGFLSFSNYKSDEQDPTSKSVTYLQRHKFPRAPYTGKFFRGSDNSQLYLGLSAYGLKLKYILFDLENSETYGCNPDFYATEYSTITKLKNQALSAEYDYSASQKIAIHSYYNYKRHELDPRTANLYLDDLDRTGIINPEDSTIIIDPFYAYGGRKYYYFRTLTHSAGMKAIYQISPNLKNITGFDLHFIDGIPIISEGKGGKPITTDEQRSVYEHSFSTKGIYSEFVFYFTDNLLFSAGGRYDFDSNMENTFMPRVAFTAYIDRHLFKFIFSKGYLSPSVTQRYFESLTTFSWIKPNENLLPEKNSSFEFSWDYSKDNFQVSANAFYNKLENGIIESVHTPDSTKIILDNKQYLVPILQSQNVSDGYRYGISLGLAQQIDRQINFSINYSFIDGQDNVQGLKVNIGDNLVSLHTIAFDLLYKYEKYSLFAEFIYSGKKRIKSNHYSTGYANLLDNEGYLNFGPDFLVNINFRVSDFYEGLSFSFRVKNLFDTEYYGQTINATWGSPKILQDLRRIDAVIEYEL